MKKILIVDDDQDILDAVEMALNVQNYDTHTSTTSEALEKSIQSYKPDLILLDVLLSGNDGRDLCKKLKENKKLKKIPVVMMSAHPLAKDLIKECHAESFLAKPFSVHDLLDSVEKYIN